MPDSRIARPPLDHTVDHIRGVGPARAAQLARLGIHTVEDLLHHLPSRYDDRRVITPIGDLAPGTVATIRGTIRGVREERPFGRRGGPRRAVRSVIKAAITDRTGVVIAVWFNQPYLRGQLSRGAQVVLTGRVEQWRSQLQVQSPDLEVLEPEDEAMHAGRIVPVYPATEGLTPRMVRTIIREALEEFAGAVSEMLPEAVRAQHALMGIRDALWKVHFPGAEGEAEASRRRLAFQELFLLQIGVLIRRRAVERLPRTIRYRRDGDLTDRWRASLPFALTGAQARVIDETHGDMFGPRPMNRLLQGDVGSGKTAVAAAALVTCVQGGYQGAVMAPTEILADQHYLTFRRMLDPLGVRVVLLTGGMDVAGRDAGRAAAQRGDADVVVGTHALIQEAVAFARLGLVVIDEQHKFGVAQRALLRRKGAGPDVLVMTATPIPRTLALTLYGDLDVSVLDEMPAGRGRVSTHWRRPADRAKVYEFVRQEVAAGRQIFVVCPLVEESEKVDARAATELHESLARGELTGVSLGLLHGRMRVEDKEQVMARFRAGEIAVLVATPVIEVGVDVPNATVMVIEDAGRFGLAQLHQLRGRIGRGAARSYCILIDDPATEEAERRIRTMTATTDGFAIAQEDLALRGPGELLGVRQHGLPDFRVADPIKDLPLLEEARRAALDYLRQDAELRQPVSRALRDAVQRRFGGRLELAAIS
ncbi:MAG: ATP-dependent DNA helicase RecG [Armatimonadetes bacterium]|nr:ATP-dependent DNA helicase RecG [Armatimonadota bacterium]